jgi:hypothetical protein
MSASVISINRLDEGPLAVGSRVVIRQPRFPPAVWRVTAFEPGTAFTWVYSGVGISVTGDHRIAPAAGGSRVTLSLDYRGIVGWLVATVTTAITNRYIAMEAAGLKRQAESPS